MSDAATKEIHCSLNNWSMFVDEYGRIHVEFSDGSMTLTLNATGDDYKKLATMFRKSYQRVNAALAGPTAGK